MDIVKKILQVIAGVAFWAVVIDWVFLDGYYNPFIDLKDKPAAESEQNPQSGSAERAKQTAQHSRTGISIFASTEEPGRAQQLHFSYNMPREAAIASAAKKCNDHIASSRDDFVCEELSFFSSGCFVRYRLGDGHSSSFGATQAEAAGKAEQNCRTSDPSSSFSCVRDTNMCVDGGDNQGTRQWNSNLFGLTEVYPEENNKKASEVFDGRGLSLKAQRRYVENQCRNQTGKNCKTILTLTGDQCVAFAFSANGAHYWVYGSEQDKTTLISEARISCTSRAGRECMELWKCADMVSSERH